MQDFSDKHLTRYKPIALERLHRDNLCVVLHDLPRSFTAFMMCWVTGAEALWRRSSGDERRDAISTLSQRAAANVNDDRGHTGTEVTTEHRCGHSTRLLFTP
ncbi:Hypothetical protein SMAX5B_019579 [Scophthalmus maximus]|uniref:Uncharacterized protein n=1 Tax=Scophthalmus maximus TaxID=52904 RepID=A0A2U9CZQ4_SCOMX|nr:Hypothetical protein SMAX5B_019579 [Scophthalmus maximus]